jgi:hypothetical protein
LPIIYCAGELLRTVRGRPYTKEMLFGFLLHQNRRLLYPLSLSETHRTIVPVKTLKKNKRNEEEEGEGEKEG